MTELTWGSMLSSLLRDEPADPDQLRWAMELTLTGEATPAQIAGWLVALRARAVDARDLNALLDVMLEHAVRIEVPGVTVDTCGTGGDGAQTVNISTMSAVVVAAAGVKVVKHGNRAASSKCGSADLLEFAGIRLDLTPEQVVQVAEQTNITFCFAPAFHPAARFAGPVRRELGIRTAFNVLGPLANPAAVKAQAVGVSDIEVAPVVAEALLDRGVKAIVYRGQDGLDEVSVSAPTDLWVALGGQVERLTITPAEFGIAELNPSALRGDDAVFNLQRMNLLFDRSQSAEVTAIRPAVGLSAAVALVAARAVTEPITDVVDALQNEYARALDLIDSGAAARKWAEWRSAMPA